MGSAGGACALRDNFNQCARWENDAADIGIKVLGNFSISTAVAWLLGAGGAGYGMAQNKLRKDTVERLQKRNQDLERSFDQRRSSSRLTTRGDTRPGDEV